MNKKRLIYLLLPLIFIGGCSRYEDGGMFSLRSVHSRLVNTWTLEEYYVNDTDLTEEFYMSAMGFTLSLYDNNNYNMYCNFETYEGEWAVDEKKLYFTMDNEGFINLYGEIIRLKKNEFWLRTDEDGVITEYHFIGDE